MGVTIARINLLFGENHLNIIAKMNQEKCSSIFISTSFQLDKNKFSHKKKNLDTATNKG